MRLRTAPALLLLLGCLAVAANGAAEAAEPGLWSAGRTTLRTSGRNYLVATASGERPVTLPAGVEVEELFALRQGAFLSGRRASGPLATDASERRDLFLALVDGQGLHALPSPASGTGAGRLRENAVPLTSAGGDLDGVVWLEGADRQSYAVHHASWNGMGWSESEVIAAQAPGSQLALAGATLADGAKLLVWSRFDGEDDEIVATRFDDGEWSPARAIAADNAVPDVTPSVVAVPGGALATWSRYDGHDYRVVISRLDGREWSAPAWAGPAGSTVPTLTPAIAAAVDGDRTAGVPTAATGATGTAASWLTFASAQPRGWGVLELDPTGRVLRRGSAVDVPAARPAVTALPAGELRLRWATVARDVELR